MTEQKTAALEVRQNVEDLLPTAAEMTPKALELALAQHDLGGMNSEQRVSFVRAVCLSLGVNPLTMPFQFISFEGKTMMYGTKGLAAQLRKINGVSITSVEKKVDGTMLWVTTHAKDREGRVDTDTGFADLAEPEYLWSGRGQNRKSRPNPNAGQMIRGVDLGNAVLKAVTKSKRRVTFSICGLGFLDVSEVDDIPGAAFGKRFEAKDETPADNSPLFGSPYELGPPFPGEAEETQEARNIRPATRTEVMEGLAVAMAEARRQRDEGATTEAIRAPVETYIEAAGDEVVPLSRFAIPALKIYLAPEYPEDISARSAVFDAIEDMKTEDHEKAEAEKALAPAEDEPPRAEERRPEGVRLREDRRSEGEHLDLR